ncbi:MAG: UvrB/UvrC motif-containing protein [Lachnospiraceae bacterium]
MLCERCRIREANIQYTEVLNGVKTEHHFCAQCARELDFGPYSAIFDSDFPLGKLLSGLLGINEEQKEDKRNQVICPTCKTSYEDFVKNSCFGCPDCYGVFDLLICDNIRQLQGSDRHTGKHPRYHLEPEPVIDDEAEESIAQAPAAEVFGTMDLDVKEQIRILQAKLQEALDREEYESAAVCRDKIRALKEGVR